MHSSTNSCERGNISISTRRRLEMTVHEMYDQSIKRLPASDRLHLAKLIINDLPEADMQTNPTLPAFGEKSVADIIQEVGYIESTGSSDMGRHPGKYMQGFGSAQETRKP
jgi:hypothetical protein